MSFRTDRRDFLAVLATVALGSRAFAATLPSPRKGSLLLGLSSGGDTSTLRFLDWDSGGARDYILPLENPHAFLIDRKNHGIVYSFENFGSAARLNLETGEAVRVNHHRSDTLFSGHAVQSTSGELLFCTEIDRKLGVIVSIRSAKDLKRIGIAPKECGVSHQVVHLPNSNVFAVGNMDERHGGITFYDYEKSQIVQSVEFGVPIHHLVALSSTEALGVSNPCKRPKADPVQLHARLSSDTSSNYLNNVTFFPGPIVYAKTDGSSKKFFLETEPDLFRFSFAVAPLPKSGMFLSSQQVAGKVLLWKDGEVIRRFEVESPSHLFVAKDGSQFMVRSRQSVAKVFSLETYQELREVSDPKGRILLLGSY